MWNMQCNNNKIVQTRKTTQEQKRHLLGIAYARPQIDTQIPWKPSHSLSKFTNKYTHTRDRKIYEDNQVLLKKMMSIQETKTQLNPIKQKEGSIIFKSLWGNLNKTENQQMAQDNLKLMQRLRQCKSAYGRKMWFINNKQQEYKDNLQQKNKRYLSNNAFIDYSELAKSELPTNSKVFKIRKNTMTTNSQYSTQVSGSQSLSKSATGFKFALDHL